MPIPVGIDLGTTNSVISAYRRGRPETLKVDGQETMPSAVCFRDKRTVLVGVKARNMALVRPESTVLSVKRKMGDRNYSYRIHDNPYSPVEIATWILEKLCEDQEQHLGGKPTDAVITVPAYFTDEQRRDTKLAGEAAGLNVLRLLPEPTAAAIAIGLDKGRDQTILVYDLGGGTFDVSILKVEDNDFRVQAVNGDHDLGGDDFDLLLRDHVLDLFLQQQKVDLRQLSSNDPEVQQSLQMLTTACESLKIELADADESYLDLPNFFQGKHLTATVTRATFETLIRPLIDRSMDLVLRTISDAKLDVDDIDQLVLVGGSTKIPLVRKVLSETIKEPYIADHVDLAVSHGAAIMAANLHAVADASHQVDDFAPVEISVTDVCAHPISIGLEESPDVWADTVVVIEKNAPLRAMGTAIAYSYANTTGAALPVYRGDNPDLESNEYLGELVLTFESSPDQHMLRFELALDESGVLLVEGSILDLCGRHIGDVSEEEASKLPSKRKVRAEIKLPD